MISPFGLLSLPPPWSPEDQSSAPDQKTLESGYVIYDSTGSVSAEDKEFITGQMNTMLAALSPEFKRRFALAYGESPLQVKLVESMPGSAGGFAAHDRQILIPASTLHTGDWGLSHEFGHVIRALMDVESDNPMEKLTDRIYGNKLKKRITELYQWRVDHGGPWLERYNGDPGAEKIFYASKDEFEYFAESVAAFERGTSGHFDKTWLRREDPGMWELLCEVLDDQAPVVGPAVEEPEDSEWTWSDGLGH